MKARQIKDDLEVAHYLWGGRKFEQEIRQGFPSLGRFATGTVPRRLAFLRTLPIEQQLRYASALVKRGNSEAIRLLGLSYAPEERHLVYEFRDITTIPTPRELERDISDLETVPEFGNTREGLRAFIAGELIASLGEPEKRTPPGGFTAHE